MLHNNFLDESIARKPADQQWRTGDQLAAQRPVRQPSHCHVEKEASGRLFTIRAGGEARNSAATREKVALKKHGIAQLGANFVITCDESTSRSTARGVSSIMSMATEEASQAGFNPTRRAITLFTQSAATTIGATGS